MKDNWTRIITVICALTISLLISACDKSGGEGSEENTSAEAPRTATAEEIAAYPLENCVVSGEPLGSMGDAINLFHEGQLVRLCCDNCIESFNEEPVKFITKITEAAAAKAGEVK